MGGGGRRPGAQLVDLGELVQQLTDRIDSLVPLLLPAGRQHGPEYVDAATSKGGLGDSLSVRMSGARKGVWAHFSANRGGDLLDLIAYVRTGGNKADAIRWAKDWLGLGTDGAGKPDPEAAERAKRLRAQKAQAEALDSERRTAFAQALWLKARPLERGDVVDRYLGGRGIGLLQLGRRPNCLRASQPIRHPDGEDWLAMLASMVRLSGKQTATHRTFLAERDGRITKAPLGRPKLVLGDYKGAHIPLWKGAHRETLRALPAGVPVYVSEGIEDGLSAARLVPTARIIAAASLSNMAGVELPPQVREVVLIGQNDPATLADGRPHPAIAGMARAVAAHEASGRQVRIARPPARLKDFNEWVQELVQLGELA